MKSITHNPLLFQTVLSLIHPHSQRYTHARTHAPTHTPITTQPLSLPRSFSQIFIDLVSGVHQLPYHFCVIFNQDSGKGVSSPCYFTPSYELIRSRMPSNIAIFFIMYTEGQRLSFLFITIHEHTVIIHIGLSKKGIKVTPSR